MFRSSTFHVDRFKTLFAIQLVFSILLIGTVVTLANAATFTVDRADDPTNGNYGACSAAKANDCSFRGALEAANANGAAADTINFAIPGGGVQVIHLTKSLPDIKTSLTINGATQSGYFGKPMIQIDGYGINSYGITVTSPYDPVADLAVTVIGLSITNHINGFFSYCMERCDITLLGNFVGVDPTGTVAMGNGRDGIRISPTNGSVITIGGAGVFEGNLISGNATPGQNYGYGGIAINPSERQPSYLGSAEVKIIGNKIGTDFSGSADLGNAEDGITIHDRDETGLGHQLDLTVLIGGTTPGARNIISGNNDSGIYAECLSLTVVGNYIGTNASGTAAIPNGDDDVWADYGVRLTAKSGSVYRIGGDKSGEGNLISGNRGDAISVATGAGGQGTTQLSVMGNYIGTNASGSAGISNSDTGIYIDSDTNYTVNATIGGVTAGARNIISGNGGNGIAVGSGNISIYGNYIGTDKDGAADLGNVWQGVYVMNSANVTIGGTLVINGSSYDAGNLISGNDHNGIYTQSSTVPLTIKRNRIGTNIGGTFAIPNGQDGISLGSDGNTVGSETSSQDGNVISGNAGNGIAVYGNNNKVFGNKIGTNGIGGDFLPNANDGVYIFNSSNNQIGMGGAGPSTNIISGNGAHGVAIQGLNSNSNKIENNLIGPGVIGNDIGNQGAGVFLESSNNTIGGTGKGNIIAFNGTGVWFRVGNGNSARANSTYSNDGLGIGWNDPPIQGFDFPVLSVANQNSISGSLVSKPTAPNTMFAIDFYRVDSCDGSGYGEGRYYLGSTSVMTDGAGNAQFNSPPVFLNIGDLVTATSTGPIKTSGFSPCLAVTSIPSLSYSTASYSANEGGGSRTIIVTRTGGTVPALSVDYSTSDGTATAGQDYVATSGTLTFNSGETIKTFDVQISEDNIDEADETINLKLSNIQGGGFIGSPSTAVLTIVDNDPSPSISINDVSQSEGNSGNVNFTFHVQLSVASGQSVSVNYATADGTATSPSDYASAGGSLTFAPGETDKVVNVSVAGDQAQEANETFFVNLSNPVNATLSDNQGLGTIVNDDTGPSLSINNVSLSEGNGGTTPFQFTVDLSSASGVTVRVDYATADVTATGGDDYVVSQGSVLFAPGETSKNLVVEVNGDTNVEADERFVVNLVAAANAVIGNGQGVGTILNDDDDPAPSPTPTPTPSPTPVTSCCSFTQSDYGDAATSFFHTGHMYDGFVMPNLLKALLGDPSFVQPLPPDGPYQQMLQLGVVGTRSLTIPLGASQCVINRLPASGGASALPNFGAGGRPVDRTLDDNSCQVPSAPGPNPQEKGLPLTNKGKFDNSLLGHTIALSLNVRLDPNLSNLVLTGLGTPVTVKGKHYRQFCTQGTNPDGSVIAGDVKTFILPQSVVDVLSNPAIVGANNVDKVSGLLVLANRALAGLSTGGVSLGDISTAVDVVNSGFENCRILVSCTGLTPSLVQDAWKEDQ